MNHRQRLTGSRLVAIFLLGCVLLNYPLLFLVDARLDFVGVPLLYAYVFAAWGGLIALMAAVIERRER